MTEAIAPVVRRGGISAWAVVSLVVSLGFCPLVTVCAIPLGILGLRDVRVNGRKGKTAAWIGIIIALVVTPLTTWFMFWWNAEVRIPLRDGPMVAIQSGMAGLIPEFESGFLGPVDESTGIEAARFIATLRDRWGPLESIRQDDSRMPEFSDNGWSVRMAYIFKFQKESVPGEAEFCVFSETDSGMGFAARFGWVMIGTDDPVTWPPSAASQERTRLELREYDESEEPAADGG
jgi:hypothetical protein